MPLLLDPARQTVDVHLACDLRAGQADPPAFRYRVPSGRDSIELHELLAAEQPDGAAGVRRVFELARRNLVGWRGIHDPVTGKPLEFDAARLEDVLTLAEAGELVGHLVALARGSPQQKKTCD